MNPSLAHLHIITQGRRALCDESIPIGKQSSRVFSGMRHCPARARFDRGDIERERLLGIGETDGLPQKAKPRLGRSALLFPERRLLGNRDKASRRRSAFGAERKRWRRLFRQFSGWSS